MALQAAFIVPHPPLIVPAVGRGREEEIRTTIDTMMRWRGRLRSSHPRRSS